jgi:hypothetical protein
MKDIDQNQTPVVLTGKAGKNPEHVIRPCLFLSTNRLTRCSSRYFFRSL